MRVVVQREYHAQWHDSIAYIGRARASSGDKLMNLKLRIFHLWTYSGIEALKKRKTYLTRNSTKNNQIELTSSSLAELSNSFINGDIPLAFIQFSHNSWSISTTFCPHMSLPAWAKPNILKSTMFMIDFLKSSHRCEYSPSHLAAYWPVPKNPCRDIIRVRLWMRTSSDLECENTDY